jgi:hypothetical protein
MGEVITFFVFAAVTVIAAVLFGVWLLVGLLKLLGRGLLLLFLPSLPPQPLSAPTFSCPRGGCRALNPSSAHFCRRCGQELLKGQLSHRRAAMW